MKNNSGINIMNRLCLFLCSLFFAFTLSGDSIIWNGKNSFKGWNGVAAAKKRIVKGILELSSIKRRLPYHQP
jgi:hypothetical protein